MTGRFVYGFGAGSMMPLLLILQEDPVPVDKRGVPLPDGLARAIDKALAREPGERFALRQALLPFRAS